MYQALYRVFRPQRFSDIVGQEAITRTLQNAIKTHKTSHAYLFTGPRGTGKTSAAKIFAKAINCLNSKDGEPCNECVLCKEITEGTLSDVIEIDAASNNGVEEIREIRDKSRYAPSQAKYKVYIIDEVHMLSIGAFNALLKTLEEPSPNVVFILATTEVYKVPATIVSRTQRFDFFKIDNGAIQKHLQYILEKETIEYDEKALLVLARAANGGMRDALSLLDQTISYAGDKITYDDALQISGSVAYETMTDYCQALYNKDVQQALTILQNLLASGKEASRFVEELILFSRDMLLFQATKHLEIGDKALAQKLVNQVPEHVFYHLIDELAQVQNAMRYTMQHAIYLEVMTIKLSKALSAQKNESNQDIQQLQDQVNALKEQIQNQPMVQSVAEVAVKRPAKTDKHKPFEVNLSKIFTVLLQATLEDKQRIQDDWEDILSTLTSAQRAKLKASTILAASPDSVVIGFEYEILCQMTQEDTVLQTDIAKKAMQIINHPCQMVCIPMDQWSDIRGKFVQAKKQGILNQYVDNQLVENTQPTEIVEEEILEEKQEENEVVSKATELFGDIVEILEG